MSRFIHDVFVCILQFEFLKILVFFRSRRVPLVRAQNLFVKTQREGTDLIEQRQRYKQSFRNGKVCQEGKLNIILANAFYALHLLENIYPHLHSTLLSQGFCCSLPLGSVVQEEGDFLSQLSQTFHSIRFCFYL